MVWCVWRNKGNGTVCECIIIYCALSLFLFVKNHDIFMAIICDCHGYRKVSWSQIFPWNHSWLNKNRFDEKQCEWFLHTNDIYCVLLSTNSSKERKDNQCLVHYWWCLVSVYHDIMTCSQQKLKNFRFFICLVDNHMPPYF